MPITKQTSIAAYIRGAWKRWLREAGPVNLKRGQHPGRHFDERVDRVSKDVATRLNVPSMEIEEVLWGLWADGEIHAHD